MRDRTDTYRTEPQSSLALKSPSFFRNVYRRRPHICDKQFYLSFIVVLSQLFGQLNIQTQREANWSIHSPVISVVSAWIAGGVVVTFRFQCLSSSTSSARRCPGNSQQYVPLRFQRVCRRIGHRFSSAPVRAVAQTEPLSSLVHRISVRRYVLCQVVEKQVLTVRDSATRSKCSRLWLASSISGGNVFTLSVAGGDSNLNPNHNPSHNLNPSSKTNLNHKNLSRSGDCPYPRPRRSSPRGHYWMWHTDGRINGDLRDMLDPKSLRAFQHNL